MRVEVEPWPCSISVLTTGDTGALAHFLLLSLPPIPLSIPLLARSLSLSACVLTKERPLEHRSKNATVCEPRREASPNSKWARALMGAASPPPRESTCVLSKPSSLCSVVTAAGAQQPCGTIRVSLVRHSMTQSRKGPSSTILWSSRGLDNALIFRCH